MLKKIKNFARSLFITIILSAISPETKAKFSPVKIFENTMTSNDINEDPQDYLMTRGKLNDTIKYPWFFKDYFSYEPEAISLNKIRDTRKHLKFVVFGGSWCDDTHMWLPKFYKTVERAGVEKKNIALYGVDRDKKPVGNLADKTAPEMDYKIDRVPTFIVYYKGKEIGRIVESVRKSVEADIALMLDYEVPAKKRK
ncbi:MAG: thioredoxin [Sphingobacteriales bacterium]|nr:MAG: thioredoxin [Sphingobacteriales bacterium]